ncbi:replication-associated recombination protein A [Ruminococcus sp. AM27-11LB]|uniref:replication-associated recombination protein A n=1 Tax=Mediterraneibacter TaxID=2316020 RepID=UPI000E4A411A|nr:MULTISPECIES: replication-associated recombination protein A [Mediterraneibacter]RGH93488.1 replication-associated recombination protein A [Ruminococcus sp. AM27-27]RGH97400.1 replication-associated recombination protein A [Ruminococcus sp. AM27-11LB]
MDLFDYMRETNKEKESPLASRMRPVTLDEVVGQKHIIGKDKLLYRAIKADKLSSLIFYGPPGTGKTTLAKVIAHTTSAEFKQINATVAGKKDMEEVVKEAKDLQGMYGKKTILFIDEIHRFNKGQQDYLLPFVEDGTLILIGATTENPYFEVNGALISRSSIFELRSLEKTDIKELLLRAVNDTEKGLGSFHAVIEDDALEFLADVSGGDARNALNAIELGVLTTDRSEDGQIHITLDVASECIQKRVVNYDKKGDNHYDIISAFIKSMRGSDPDAAVFYLAKMLYAGEDVKFIARRIMICASEDVGNADPMALTVAVAAAQAVERIGMPESQIILSQAVTYVASAPKSNSAVNAIFAANDAVRNNKTTVPTHLQDAHYKGAQKLGHGIGYKYAHDYPNHYVDQQYLPDEIKDARFYKPGDLGYEKQIKERLQKLREQ